MSTLKEKHPLPWFAEGKCPLYLAPMAGFTDNAFRSLAKAHGADVLVSEFVHARALLHGDGHPWQMIAFTEDQRPCGIQLFGDAPDTMAEAARKVCEELRPDFIDLNFGCPSPRVTGSCAGSALLKDLPQLGKIAAAVVRATDSLVPVTAKTRLGWDSTHIVVGEVLARLQDAGVQALAIHGRTRAQAYSGEANWQAIAAIADKAEIPIVANGSIATAENVRVLRSLSEKIAGVMIGRAAIGFPWIFDEIKAAQENRPFAKPTQQERWDTLIAYAKMASSHIVGDKPLRPLHSALVKFTTGMPDVRALRRQFNEIATLADLEAMAQAHLAANRSLFS